MIRKVSLLTIIFLLTVGLISSSTMSKEFATDKQSVEPCEIKLRESKELLYEGYYEPKKIEVAEEPPKEEIQDNSNNSGNNNKSQSQAQNKYEKSTSNAVSDKHNSKAEVNESVQPIHSPVNLSTEGNVTIEQKNAIVKGILMIPSDILNSFNAHGGRIIITDAQIGCGSAAGIYKAFPKKTILIKSSTRSPQTAVIHEFGHFVDDMAGFSKGNTKYGFSESTDFINNVYKTELSNIKGLTGSNYCSTNSKECFAEIFRLYITDRGSLQSAAPNSFRFVKQALGSI